MLCANVDKDVKASVVERETGLWRVECEGGVLDARVENGERVQWTGI